VKPSHQPFTEKTEEVTQDPEIPWVSVFSVRRLDKNPFTDQTGQEMKSKQYRQAEASLQASWQLQEAKACFSEVVRRAEQGPQRVTVHGKDAVVVISARDYERLRPDSKTTLGGLMANSPLTDIEFGERRDVMPVREVDL